MVTDMVAAATTIATAGTATGAVYSASRILMEMGASAATDAMAEAVADELGIDLSAETALQDVVSELNQARKESHNAYQKAFNDWRDCVGSAQVAQGKIDAYNNCLAGRMCEFK